MTVISIRGLRAGASLLAMAVAMGLAAGEASAQAGNTGAVPAEAGRVYRFDIPAKPLLAALTEFTVATGVQVFRPSGEAIGGTSAPVAGSFTAEQALSRLLSGTGLVFSFTGPRTVALTRAPGGSGGATVLAPVTVTSSSGSDVDLGNYAVKRTTAGTKTDTPISKVPSSVQVIPRAVFDDQQSLRVEEALRNVSGTVFVDGGEGKTFFSRGFSASLFIDGVLRTEFTDGDGYAADLDSFNVQRLEVLKGPASVLYGRGNPGGTINIVTKRPLSEPSYEVRGTMGAHGLARGAIDLTGPLDAGGQFGYRLNAAYEHAESFRDEVESERKHIAPVFQWKPTGDTVVLLDIEVADIDQTPDSGIPRSGNGPLAGVPRDRFLGEPTDSSQNNKEQVRLRLEHSFSDATSVRGGVGYSDTRNKSYFTRGNALAGDGRTVTRSIIDSAFEFEDIDAQVDLTQKVRLGGQEHTLLFGIEAAKRETLSVFNSATASSIDAFNPVYGNTAPTGAFSLFQQTTERKTYGAFGQAQVSITDALTLVFGGRFDWVEQERTSGASLVKEDFAFSPRVGAVYQINDPLSVYATYSRSFTPVNGFPLAFGGELLAPERAELWETGVKLSLLEDRLIGNAALYQIERQNVGTPDLANPGFQINGGEQRSRGVEFDLSGEISPGWRIIASYGYTDARVINANNNTAGRRPAGIPKHSASLWSTYEIRTGDLAGLGFGGGVFFVDDRFGNPANTFTVDSYVRVDATVYYRLDNYTFRLNVQNLLDEEYYLNPTRPNFLAPGSPTTFLFSIQGAF